MKASILSIGDELALGQTIDTNSAWISQQLASVGCDIVGHATAPDDLDSIIWMINSHAPRSDVLILSGGIGPTEDDLTREAMSRVLNQPLQLNMKWQEYMKSFFAKLGRVMPERNNVQAMIPHGATMLWNHHGTAAGIRATIQHSSNQSCEVFVVPGVPKEMKGMFTKDILPYIQERSGGAVILQRTLHTFGAGESTVAEKIGLLMQRGRNPSVGTTVSGGVVSLRVNARFDSLEVATQEINTTVAACYDALGDMIYGEGNVTLHQVLAKLLLENKKTVSVAESCTGGLLGKFLTDIPGSSAYFKQGWLTYTNESKVNLLGVDPKTLEQNGAVSEETVKEMAQGAKDRASTDYAISISGIAGPEGGTDAKPVGTVCIGIAYPGGIYTKRFNLPGDREMVRDRACKMAMTLLRYHLLNKPFTF